MSLYKSWISASGERGPDGLPQDTQAFLGLLEQLAALPRGTKPSSLSEEMLCAKDLFRLSISQPAEECFSLALKVDNDNAKADDDGVLLLLLKMMMMMMCWWERPIAIARSPGRLDVLGGISDYSGALVLQLPIATACHVAAQLLDTPDEEPTCRIVSLHADGVHRGPTFECPTRALLKEDGSPLPYADAQKLFKANPQSSWAAYVAGCIIVLSHECPHIRIPRKISMLVSSDVPEGKGVSSSAAVEVAAMTAILAALNVQLPGADVAMLCCKVENLVVGAPCGTMDQIVCTLGHPGKLTALLCQPAVLQPSVSIPENVRFWGIDSQERHSVSGCDYGSVRIGAFMGLRIATQAALERAAKRSADQAQTPKNDVVEPLVPEEPSSKRQKSGVFPSRFESIKAGCPTPLHGGYLGNIPPSAWLHWMEAALPDDMLGADFLQRYTSHYDEATTTIDPNVRYAVRQPTLHPIFESHRGSLFRQVLSAPTCADQLPLLGELMRQSHESYGRCKLGSPGTDRLVHLVQEHMEAAQAPSLFGAKITGGGSGGTVCVVGKATPEAEAAIEGIIKRYAKEMGMHQLPQVFRGSSAGAEAFGHLLVQQTP